MWTTDVHEVAVLGSPARRRGRGGAGVRMVPPESAACASAFESCAVRNRSGSEAPPGQADAREQEGGQADADRHPHVLRERLRPPGALADPAPRGGPARRGGSAPRCNCQESAATPMVAATCSAARSGSRPLVTVGVVRTMIGNMPEVDAVGAHADPAQRLPAERPGPAGRPGGRARRRRARSPIESSTKPPR